MGLFKTSVFASGSWTDEETTDWQLRVAVHDSDIATVDYRPTGGATGRFYFGFQPRHYFADPAASEPIDLQQEAAGFCLWAANVLNRRILPDNVLPMMAVDGDEEPLDDYAEDTVMKLLDLVGIPWPPWLLAHLTPLANLPEYEVAARWNSVTADVADFVAAMKPGNFVIVSYMSEGDDAPYGQFALEETLQCEVASEQFVPTDLWPLDEAYFHNTGWSAPDSESPNWHRPPADPQQSAQGVIDGMRFGRGCSDPRLFSWVSGSF